MTFIKKRIRAFGYAFEGVFNTSKNESPFMIHWLAVLIVVALGLFFCITKTEWCLIIICCGVVISVELINTAIERLCDIIMPEKNPKIKFIKDASAAAVLIVSVMAFIVGILVFTSYFKQLFS